MIGIPLLRPLYRLLWFLRIDLVCPQCLNLGGEYKAFGMMSYWHACDTCLGGSKR